MEATNLILKIKYDIINSKNTMIVKKNLRAGNSSVTLLASCVPYLSFDRFTINLDTPVWNKYYLQAHSKLQPNFKNTQSSCC